MPLAFLYNLTSPRSRCARCVDNKVGTSVVVTITESRTECETRRALRLPTVRMYITHDHDALTQGLVNVGLHQFLPTLYISRRQQLCPQRRCASSQHVDAVGVLDIHVGVTGMIYFANICIEGCSVERGEDVLVPGVPEHPEQLGQFLCLSHTIYRNFPSTRQ